MSAEFIAHLFILLFLEQYSLEETDKIKAGMHHAIFLYLAFF